MGRIGAFRKIQNFQYATYSYINFFKIIIFNHIL